jgi:hypothetical protein
MVAGMDLPDPEPAEDERRRRVDARIAERDPALIAASAHSLALGRLAAP